MIALFAQVAQKMPGVYYERPLRDDTEDYLIAAGVALAVSLLVVLVSLVLAAAARALRKVSPENRRMEPGEVWRNLIPVYNLVWLTVTAERVAESLRAEFAARGLDDPEEDYGRRTGTRVLFLLASGVFVYTILFTYPAAFIQALRYRGQMKRYAEQLGDDFVAPRAKQVEDEGW